MAIVGVAAPEFFGTTVDTETPDVWAPAAMQAALRFAGGYGRSGGDLQKPWPSQPEIAWLQVMIRVSAGGAPAAAEAMTLALQRERPPDVQDAEAVPVTLLPGSGGFSPMRSELTTPLIVLLLAVGLLLAIACANIASLLLARATTRSREMAIRLSMGAGRGRLIRQLLTESLLLASVGGALGLMLAYWGSTALLTVLARGEPVSGIDVRPDWRVMGLTFATSMATALAFGLLPALRGTSVPLAESLKAQTRSVIGAAGRGGRVPVGKVLIAGQMAVAILLLLVAGLFVRSLQALVHVDVGYDRDHVLVARIDPRSSGYTVADLPALYNRVIEGLARLPGVVACQRVRDPVQRAKPGRFLGRGLHTRARRADDNAQGMGHVRLLPYRGAGDHAGAGVWSGGFGQQPAGQRHQRDDGAAVLSQSESDREAAELGEQQL